MANAVLGKLEAGSLTDAELDQLREFINANEGTNLSLLLRSILLANEEGVGVNVLADDAEVSPNAAAKLLKMSRPHLLTFMRDGDLPYHMVGSHQRIKMSDLIEFMRAREAGAKFVAEATHRIDGTMPPADVEANSVQELEDL